MDEREDEETRRSSGPEGAGITNELRETGSLVIPLLLAQGGLE